MILTFFLTLGDSLFGCLQVYNLVNRRRASAFIVSILMGSCKISSVILVVKSSSPLFIAAYLLGGAIGAQISILLQEKLKVTVKES